MTVDFNDYFWGEKNNGYDVLYHNMKYGLVASKELSDFYRERSNIEEHYSKLLSKLAKQASSCCINGTFAPVWQILKTSVERLSSLHLQMVQKLTDLVKEINKYAEELHKKHKLVKEDESGTLEAVQAIQSITLNVQKAKDLYSQRALEVEKLKKEAAAAKDIEKAETKLKKAYDEYKTFVDKYSVIKDDFEKKMTVTNKHFQEIEEAHLIQMKDFLRSYCDVIQRNHDLVGQVHSEFRQQCLDMTVEKMMETFCLSKYTGLEKPSLIEVDDMSTRTKQNVDKDKGSAKGVIVQSLIGGVDGVPESQGGGTGTVATTVASASVTTASGKTCTKRDTQPSHDITGMQAAKQTWSPPHGPPTQATKPSRRTTSLLNLFMSNSYGNREFKGMCPNSAPSSPSITAPAGQTIADTQPQINIIRNPLRGSKWFLRSRRDKAKLKKAKKKKDADNNSNKEEKSDMDEKETECSKVATAAPGATVTAENEAPEVDEDGFSVRPKSTETWTNDKNSFYSSSDSDSDDEREQKIHVEIKPLNNGSAPMSASVDELRATVENLSLSPLNVILGRRGSNSESQDTVIKRSQSMSQQLGGGKSSGELLGFSMAMSRSQAASNASTPLSAHPYAPLQSPSTLQSPSQLTLNSPTLSASRYAELGDLFSEVGEIQPAPPFKSARQTPTPTSGYMSIPRPPSRKSESLSARGHISPSPISRADSVGSLEFRTACVPVGASRGPSPLTIGMADTIPLAVAFHEIVHSYFRGTDETKCQVKMSGDMMLSFPAGIVTILTNNPNPAKLVFRVKNVQRLNSVLPNKQLVSIDSTQSGSDNIVLEFNMSALSALLKRQSEQNPSASYFNVDILKYQIKTKAGANSCPFQLVAYWKCDKSHTDLKIDYKYNSHAMSSPSPLLNVLVSVPMDGGVKSMQSRPTSQWISESNRLLWKFTELSQHSDNNGVGSMRARFELEVGPSTPATISTQFNCEGTTLSGIDFQLIGPGYRLSLVKRRFVSGKYICDGDPEVKSKYGTIASIATPDPSSGDC